MTRFYLIPPGGGGSLELTRAQAAWFLGYATGEVRRSRPGFWFKRRGFMLRMGMILSVEREP